MSDSFIRRWNHKRLDWMRAQKLRVMKLLFDGISRKLPPINLPINLDNPAHTENVREILVLRLDDKLGDSVTATGFLRELKNAFPSARLSVVAGPVTGQIYQRQPTIDRVWISKKGLVRTLRLFSNLRKTRYDILINTSHIMNPRTIFLMSQLKARCKLGFRSMEYRLFTHHVQYDPLTDHVTTRYNGVLTELGLAPKALQYELHLSNENKAKAAELLAPFQDRRIVILNSYAGARLRSLNEKNSRSIALGILQKAPDVTVVSIGNHNDLPVIESWIRAAGNSRWVAFSETFDFFMNCALIERAKLVISPDTAIVHVASALGKSQVVVFRPDPSSPSAEEQNSRIWAPVGAKAPAKILYSREPALLSGSLGDGQEPDINDLNSEAVIEAALELLRS